MAEARSKEDIRLMLKTAVAALEDKKAENIHVIDISEIAVIADYFIVANGRNVNQIQTLVDSVEEAMHKAGFPVTSREGRGSGKWVLLDFDDIIVHIFDEENRIFYSLDKIWSDGKTVDIEDIL